MTPDDLQSETTFRRTPKGVRLVYTDTRELIVEWPDGCPTQPTSHAEACVTALAVIRAHYGYQVAS